MHKPDISVHEACNIGHLAAANRTLHDKPVQTRTLSNHYAMNFTTDLYHRNLCYIDIFGIQDTIALQLGLTGRAGGRGGRTRRVGGSEGRKGRAGF